MSRWPADNQSALIKFYGTPGPEVEAQLVPVTPPFRMTYDGKPIKSIRFHKKAALALAAALEEIWQHYGRDQAKIDALGISKYAGAYNPRFIRGSTTKWSNHAYGAAIDLNAEDNGFGKGKGTIPQPVVDAFKRQGARWGGDYKGRTDPMHFEFCDNGQPEPIKFVDAPETDNGSDAAPTAVVPVDGSSDTQEQQIQDSAERDAEPRASWLRRKWKGATAWLTGGGVTGLAAYLTDPWAIVAIIATCAGVALVIGTVIVIFMGPGDVRAWIRKQVT